MKFSQHSWYIRWYYFKVGHKTSWIARNWRHNHNTNKFVLERRQGSSRWQHNLPRDKDGISHEEFNRYLGRAQNVDDDPDRFVGRFQDVIDRQWHQVKVMVKRKVIGTKGTTQTRNQARCSRQNDMMRKIDVSLAHHWKLCSGNKDQVAQLKFSTIMI